MTPALVVTGTTTELNTLLDGNQKSSQKSRKRSRGEGGWDKTSTNATSFFESALLQRAWAAVFETTPWGRTSINVESNKIKVEKKNMDYTAKANGVTLALPAYINISHKLRDYN